MYLTYKTTALWSLSNELRLMVIKMYLTYETTALWSLSNELRLMVIKRTSSMRSLYTVAYRLSVIDDIHTLSDTRMSDVFTTSWNQQHDFNKNHKYHIMNKQPMLYGRKEGNVLFNDALHTF